MHSCDTTVADPGEASGATLQPGGCATHSCETAYTDPGEAAGAALLLRGVGVPPMGEAAGEAVPGVLCAEDEETLEAQFLTEAEALAGLPWRGRGESARASLSRPDIAAGPSCRRRTGDVGWRGPLPSLAPSRYTSRPGNSGGCGTKDCARMLSCAGGMSKPCLAASMHRLPRMSDGALAPREARLLPDAGPGRLGRDGILARPGVPS